MFVSESILVQLESCQVQRLANSTRGVATIAPMKSYDRARAKVGKAERRGLEGDLSEDEMFIVPLLCRTDGYIKDVCNIYIYVCIRIYTYVYKHMSLVLYIVYS